MNRRTSISTPDRQPVLGLRLGSCTVLLMALFCSAANAQIERREWRGGFNGDWFAGANWEGGQRPEAGEIARIDGGNPHDPFIGALITPWYDSVWINGSSQNNGLLTVRNSARLRSRSVLVGNASQARGTLLVTGQNTRVQLEGVLQVGSSSSARGEVIVDEGARVESQRGRIGIGMLNVALPRGAVSVIGPQSRWMIEEELEIGRYARHATLNVLAGGLVQSRDAHMGTEAGSRSDALVANAGSAWNQSGNLLIGVRGEAELTISSAGRVDTGTFAAVGLAAGSTGSVILSSSNTLWTIGQELTLGGGGSGSLDLRSGARIESGPVLLAVGPAATAVARVRGTASHWLIDGELSVGGSGAAELSVENGALVSADRIVLAEWAQSEGVLRLGNGAVPGRLDTPEVHAGEGLATLRFLHDADRYEFSRNAEEEGEAILLGGLIDIEHSGTGSTVLRGHYSHQGDTVIDAGTLIVLRALPGAISVGGSGTLAGDGQVAEVGVAQGGRIAPGDGIGTLGMDSLTLAPGARLAFELGPPGFTGAGINDLIQVAGDLHLDGELHISHQDGFGVGSYTLLSYGGQLDDHGLTLAELPLGLAGVVDTGTPGLVRLHVAASWDPTLWSDRSHIGFGDVPLGGSSAIESLHLHNGGIGPLQLGQAAITGPDAADFSLEADLCSGQVLAGQPAAASCRLDLQFQPGDYGHRRAWLEIPSNDPQSPFRIALRGSSDVVFHGDFEAPAD